MSDGSNLRVGLPASTLKAFMYYQQAIEFEALYKAMKSCCRNLRWKDSVTGYESNGLKNTYLLRQELLNGTYKIRPYQHFTIYEPKKRDIVATRFRDRQFQMALCKSGLYDDLVEHFIKDNPACQTLRGTDYTLNRMTAHLRRYNLKHGCEGYVLKLDIKKFFPSTNHEVAKREIARYIKDKDALNAVCTIIDSFDGDVGIGLGSQISQLVELCVLTRLDHYIKERLRIKHYIRYMDDMIIVHPDKDFLKGCLTDIRDKLKELGFELNSKTQIYPLRHGVKLMKWRYKISKTGKIVRYMEKAKLGRQRRKLKRIYAREVKGTVPKGSTLISLESWLANAKRGDTYYQRQRMISFYKELIRNDRT